VQDNGVLQDGVFLFGEKQTKFLKGGWVSVVMEDQLL
jgi:hypothetical protein